MHIALLLQNPFSHTNTCENVTLSFRLSISPLAARMDVRGVKDLDYTATCPCYDYNSPKKKKKIYTTKPDQKPSTKPNYIKRRATLTAYATSCRV
jgi:hypothetical protein